MRADGASMSPAATSLAVPAASSAWARFLDGDVWHSFRSSPMAMTAAAVALVCTFCALFAGVVAPHNPFDLATLELGDSMLPPS
jgi:peptide/nickel transport system permease protein